MSIISPENSFAERIPLLSFVVGEDAEYVLNFLPVALTKTRMTLLF